MPLWCRRQSECSYESFCWVGEYRDGAGRRKSYSDSVTVWREKRYEMLAGGIPRLEIMGMLLHTIGSMCIKLQEHLL